MTRLGPTSVSILFLLFLGPSWSFLALYRNSRNFSNRIGSGDAEWETFMPPVDCRVDRMSPTDLAYIGDAVYELVVRSSCVWPPKRTSDLQNKVVSLVRAEYQAELLDKLKSAFALTENEMMVLSRGRNAVSRNRRNPAAYQDATALEALIGYLYITDRSRCTDILAWIRAAIETEE